jgi:hypothetical protein
MNLVPQRKVTMENQYLTPAAALTSTENERVSPVSKMVLSPAPELETAKDSRGICEYLEPSQSKVFPEISVVAKPSQPKVEKPLLQSIVELQQQGWLYIWNPCFSTIVLF